METKELILKKALDMFAKSGYDSVSIRDIKSCEYKRKLYLLSFQK